MNHKLFDTICLYYYLILLWELTACCLSSYKITDKTGLRNGCFFVGLSLVPLPQQFFLTFLLLPQKILVLFLELAQIESFCCLDDKFVDFLCIIKVFVFKCF